MVRQSLLAAAAIAFVAAGAPQTKAQTQISISCGAVGQELEICKQGVEAWSKQSGVKVNIVSTPNSTTERLALYQQILASGASDIDVFQVDVIWPGILGNHFIDLKPYMGGAEKKHFASIVENNTVNGALVAMPWYTDAGVLYYRKDLLEKHGAKVPTTWQELTATAKKIQDAERAAGNDRMWGFVFQGSAYEGLTCNVMEWLDAFGAGAVVDAKGEVTVNNPRAAEALSLAASWIGTISPSGVLNYKEEDARGVFQSGNAVFMRNWPYAWALGNSADSPVRGKIGVVALPKGGPNGKNTGTLGGWQLAVSKYSKNQKAAAELVAYLTSEAEQKRRAIQGSYNPTIGSLYQDKDVLAAVPFFGDLYSTFTNAVARPSKVTGANYNRVSNALWNAAHETLSGKSKAADALVKLDGELKRIRRSGW